MFCNFQQNLNVSQWGVIVKLVSRTKGRDKKIKQERKERGGSPEKEKIGIEKVEIGVPRVVCVGFLVPV